MGFKFGFKAKKKGSLNEKDEIVMVQPFNEPNAEWLDQIKCIESPQLPKVAMVRPKSKDDELKKKNFRDKRLSVPLKMDIIRIENNLLENLNNTELWRSQFTLIELAGLLLSPKEIERQEIIHELIHTESIYISDLNIINQLYIQPLLNNNLIDELSLDQLFLNIKDMIELHEELIQQFHDRAKEQTPIIKEIADILMMRCKQFNLYLFYLTNQNQATKTYHHLIKNNSKFNKFISNQQKNPLSKGLDLQGYLIKPLQRLSKYPLLLKHLLEVSSSGTLDYLNAVRAKHAIEGLLTKIQDTKFNLDHQPIIRSWHQKQLALKFKLSDPNRKCIIEGTLELITLNLISTNSRKDKNKKNALEKELLYIVLFNDVMAYLPDKHRLGLNGSQLLASNHQELVLCRITDVKDLDDDLQQGLTSSFKLMTLDRNCTNLILKALNPTVKLDWLQQIRLILPNHTNP